MCACVYWGWGGVGWGGVVACPHHSRLRALHRLVLAWVPPSRTLAAVCIDAPLPVVRVMARTHDNLVLQHPE